MRLVVDLTRCQGYAQCAFLAPSAFTMHGDEALLYDPDPSDEQRERVLRAAAACPVQALVLDPVGSRNGAPKADTAPKAEAPGNGRRADEGFLRSGRIVIVGASLAGLRAASALRHEGFAGSLTVIGDEAHGPYDRPPLSKQVLNGWVPAARTGLPRRDDVEAEWRLGVPATELDLAGEQVRLADGERVGFDRLLIATGVRARPWPNPAEAALDGVVVLRTRDDADRLQRLLAAQPGRVLVIGAGFTGSEVASVCRGLGLAVTVVRQPRPRPRTRSRPVRSRPVRPRPLRPRPRQRPAPRLRRRHPLLLRCPPRPAGDPDRARRARPQARARTPGRRPAALPAQPRPARPPSPPRRVRPSSTRAADGRYHHPPLRTRGAALRAAHLKRRVCTVPTSTYEPTSTYDRGHGHAGTTHHEHP